MPGGTASGPRGQFPARAGGGNAGQQVMVQIPIGQFRRRPVVHMGRFKSVLDHRMSQFPPNLPAVGPLPPTPQEMYRYINGRSRRTGGR